MSSISRHFFESFIYFILITSANPLESYPGPHFGVRWSPHAGDSILWGSLFLSLSRVGVAGNKYDTFYEIGR